MKNKERLAEFIKLIERAAARRNTWEVFRDFCALSAISLANAIQKDEKREKEYLDTISRYDAVEQKCLASALGVLTLSLEEEVTDFLGTAYQDLGANNKHFGQFFTPFHMCEFINDIVRTSENKLLQTIMEPACGSGAMLLPTCKKMRETPEKNNSLLFIANDLDLTCVHMAYIQLTLCGANAIITHGDALKLEVYSTWVTLSLAVNFNEVEARQRAQTVFDYFGGGKDGNKEVAQKIEEARAEIPEHLLAKGFLFDVDNFKNEVGK